MLKQFINEYLADLMSRGADSSMLKMASESLVALSDRYEVVHTETEIVPAGLETNMDLLGWYLTCRYQDGLSKATLKHNGYIIKSFFDFARTPIGDIKQYHVRRWFDKIERENKISKSTLDNYRITLSKFFSWCVEQGYITDNPVKTITKIKYIKNHRQAISEEDVCKIKMACQDIRETAMVNLFLATGLRISELSNIKLSDVSWDTGKIDVIGKGNKPRSVYMTDSCRYILKLYLGKRTRKSDYLFCADIMPHNKLSNSGIRKILHTIGDRCGVDFVAHMLRHTFATHAANHGMDIQVLQKILGHNSLDTTMIYAHVDSEHIREEQRKYAV